MGKHCDIFHIFHPANVVMGGHALADVAPGKTIGCLDLELAPNTRSHLLGPDIYKLQLRIAGANFEPVVTTIELTQTGNWFDDEAKMFSDGVGFRAVP
jgi:hypothetical protein